MPVWLPLLLAALAVLAIYLIRPTAQTISVASTLLWRRLLAARRRRHDRLRWLLSLLLAMTVTGCLALAMGQAPWLQPGGGERIALAFDPSPTMQAALPGGTGSRMTLAVAEARRTIAEAATGSRFTLGADPTPLTRAEALLALSGSFESFASAVPSAESISSTAPSRFLESAGRRSRSAAPGDRASFASDFAIVGEPPSWGPHGAARGRADLQPAIPSAEVAYLFTDGVSDWQPITDPATATRTVSVLAPGRNAGIVLFVTRPVPSHQAKPEALLEVLATDAADAADPVPVELTVADSETIRIRRQLELPPGDRFTALIDIAGFAPGPITAQIRTPGDVFSADDRATLVDARTRRAGGGQRSHGARRVVAQAPVRALVQARSRASFDDSAAALAFEANPAVEVVAVHGESEPSSPSAAAANPDADVVVFHRSAPTSPPVQPNLFLDPPDAAAVAGLSAADLARSARGRIDRVDAGHPLLSGVSLLGLPATIAARELDPRCRRVAAAGDLTAIAVCDPAEPAAASLAAGPQPDASQPASPDPALPDLPARSVVVAFDLDLSPLSRRPDLAALLQNATEWLAVGDIDNEERAATGLQDERATRINDSQLDPVAPDRLAELTEPTRRPWSWRTLALAGLLLASLEAVTFFRGLTV